MDYKIIELTQNKYAVVDDEDYDRLRGLKWHYHSSGYAVHGGNHYRKISKTYMHRLIINAPKNMEVDHINGDGLDNRKENLRIVTKAENAMNRSRSSKNNHSGFKGVSFYKRLNKWQAYINKDRKFIFLGYFDAKIEAAKAYDTAAKQYFGEFAKLNYA